MNNNNSPNTERRQNGNTSLIGYTYENHSWGDLFSIKNHSDDFVLTRHLYIASRLWMMCLFYAITVPVFAPMDYLLFDSALSGDLLTARLMLSASLLGLAFMVKTRPQIPSIRTGLFLAFLLPSLFYFYCMKLFQGYQVSDIPLVFTSLPFLILAMLGLFPLTLIGSVALLLAIFSTFTLSLVLFTAADMQLLLDKIWLFILFAGISLWLQSGQLSMLMKLYRECTVDPLTRLVNRRVLLRRAQHIQSSRQPFSVLMLDLDRFKRINDTYGHHTGDRVLKMAADVMRETLRSTDVLARFGGEEFIALLPCTGRKAAAQIANRLKDQIECQQILLDESHVIQVTCSIGVAEYRPGESISNLFSRADDLLYQAKSEGRNLVKVDAMPTLTLVNG